MDEPSLTYTEPTRAPHATSGLAERIGRRYFLLFLLAPLLGYLFPIVAERSPMLADLSVSRWGHALDYTYTLHGEDADVLLFGDSSATVNVDTVKLSHDLGLKVINLPNSLGSLPIMQDQLLRTYLANNRPPRLIVFHFTPWDMNFKTTSNDLVFEGIEQEIRHGSPSEIWNTFLQHPLDTLVFPLQFYRDTSALTDPIHLRSYRLIPVLQGHTDLPKTRAFRGECTMPAKLIGVTQTQSVQELVRDFTTAQTKTLVYLPPLPDCARAEEIAAQHYPGITAEPPAIYPHTLFSADGFYTHMLEQGIGTSTLLLEKKIQAALNDSEHAENVPPRP